MKLIFATHNQGKLKEMKNILEGLDVEILSADEIGITEEVEEDGETLEENALKKAKYVAEKCRELSVSDDTGLFIKALGGAPGVRSARWAGNSRSKDKVLKHTLHVMKNVKEGERDAFFESVVVLAKPNGKHWVFRGKIEGKIALRPRGKPRFRLPYDQLFISEGKTCTFAEMSSGEKNNLSHRGLAFKKLKKFLMAKMF